MLAGQQQRVYCVFYCTLQRDAVKHWIAPLEPIRYANRTASSSADILACASVNYVMHIMRVIKICLFACSSRDYFHTCARPGLGCITSSIEIIPNSAPCGHQTHTQTCTLFTIVAEAVCVCTRHTCDVLCCVVCVCMRVY